MRTYTEMKIAGVTVDIRTDMAVQVQQFKAKLEELRLIPSREMTREQLRQQLALQNVLAGREYW